MTSDKPTLAFYVDTPSAAAGLGYMVLGTGLIGTATLAPAGVYVDDAASLRTLATARGSDDPSDALFHAQAGTMSALLDNRTRAFDPLSNTDIRPRRSIKAVATWNAVDYPMFTGFVDQWQLEYPGKSSTSDAITTVQAIDGTDLLVDLNVTERLDEQTTGRRVSDLLDLTEWPVRTRAIDTGQSTMPAHDSGTVSGWSALVEATDSEFGELYVAADGTMTFRDRTAVSSETRTITSQATFGDGGGSELPFYDVTLSYDTKRIRNDIAVVYNEAGDTAYASDSISISKYGRMQYQVQVSINDDSTPQRLAALLLMIYKDPQVRIDTLVLKPRRNPTLLWPQALGRELGDRVTVKVTPPGGGSRISSDVFLRGIHHDVASAGDDWTTTFTFQSAATFTGYFIIGTSQIGSTTDLLWF